MTISYEQAIALLVNNPADYTTEAALLALTNQVSVEANGSVTSLTNQPQP